MPSKQLRALCKDRATFEPISDDEETLSTEETIGSIDPEPSHSGVFFPTIPKLCLKQSFPSIFKTVNAMNAARRRLDKLTFYTLAPVFLGTFEAVIHSLDGLPYDIQSDSDYEVAKYQITLLSRLLKDRLNQPSPEMKVRKDLKDAMRSVIKAMEKLMEFLETTQRVFASHKPLPLLPLGLQMNANVFSARRARPYVPLSVIIEEEMSLSQGAMQPDSPSSKDALMLEGSSEAHQHDIPRTTVPFDDLEEKPGRSRAGSLIKRILRRKAAFSQIPQVISNVSPSPESSTVADSNELLSLFARSSIASATRPEQPYHPHQSLFYFILPTIDVDMPLPRGDTVALRLDSEGRVKGASLAAMVRLLTSKRGVSERDYLTTFFVCFRFYATSHDLLDELKKRFLEEPPGPLNDDQLQVWVNHTIAVRIRVGRVIQMWLDLYWRPVDDEIMDELQAFALEQLSKELPEKLMDSILEGLNAACAVHGSATRAQDLLFTYQRLNPAILPPTNIHFNGQVWDPSTGELSMSSAAVREEFARQLTTWTSTEMQKVDVEALIRYWEREDDDEVDVIMKKITRLERKLCLFVVKSVLGDDSPEERAQHLEYWVDVAARCLRLRNFSGAHAIFCGLGHSSVHRLKESILRVELASKFQYQVLEQMFDPRTNYHGYRQALSGIEPTIPLCSVHFRDITTALKVMARHIGMTEGDAEKKLINIRSYGILMKTVRGIERFTLPYGILRNGIFLESLADYFDTFPEDDNTENVFHDLSLLREQRNPNFSWINNPWHYVFTSSLNAEGGRECLLVPSAERIDYLEDPFALPVVFEKAF